MAKKIIWTLTAHEDRRKILLYWTVRNKSKTYSEKVNKLFIEAIGLIAEFPQIGKNTNDSKARLKVVRDYFIVYEEQKDAVVILRIWDYRQNPEDLMI
ncbi:MAG TPA: type II toxin-antitoxin system RelE/ParE family toxin [Arachidicoccus soli]|jgi:toxin YoeB|nr:type II toxin-antitoxin system RelE/ParE family toxin [Arachidicoccus soli]